MSDTPKPETSNVGGMKIDDALTQLGQLVNRIEALAETWSLDPSSRSKEEIIELESAAKDSQRITEILVDWIAKNAQGPDLRLKANGLQKDASLSGQKAKELLDKILAEKAPLLSR